MVGTRYKKNLSKAKESVKIRVILSVGRAFEFFFFLLFLRFYLLNYFQFQINLKSKRNKNDNRILYPINVKKKHLKHLPSIFK